MMLTYIHKTGNETTDLRVRMHAKNKNERVVFKTKFECTPH